MSKGRKISRAIDQIQESMGTAAAIKTCEHILSHRAEFEEVVRRRLPEESWSSKRPQNEMLERGDNDFGCDHSNLGKRAMLLLIGLLTDIT